MNDTMTSTIRRATVSGPVQVNIENHRGDVTIEAVPGLVEATAELRSTTAVDLESMAPVFDGDRLRIEIPQFREGDAGSGFVLSFGGKSWGFGKGGPTVAVTVRVPQGSTVQARTHQGDVTLSGSYGEVDLSTGEGDVSVDRAGATQCSTGSGDIQVRHVDGDAKLNTGSGDIRLDQNTGAVKASTGSGDVEVAAVVGEGKLSSGSGDLTVGRLEGFLKLSSGSGDFVVREVVSGRVQGQTASGDITLGVKSGVPVWTDVQTMTGDVRSDLRGAGEPQEGQPSIELRATTVSGDVVLHEV